MTLKRMLIQSFFLLFFSCNNNLHEKKQEKTPKKFYYEENSNKLIKFNDKNVVYSYFEEFGFDNICFIYIVATKYSFEEEKNWKDLPVSELDFRKISKFDEIVNQEVFRKNILSINYQFKNYFKDISLNSTEFVDNDSITINLLKGKYRISENYIEIYDPQNRILYHQMNFCN